MQIQVIKSFADAEFRTAFRVGEVLNLTDGKKARSLIASGYAKPFIDGVETADKNPKGK
jgi:hypothetical protein